MTDRVNDGGPAFPTEHYDSGMTLRDYFAGQALAGISGDEVASANMEVTDIAEWCFNIADAMLEARK